MVLTAVSLEEIERIFAILDRLGISREAVVIPLRPVHPGGVRVIQGGKNDGKLEITVESETPLAEWLPELEAKIRRLLGAS